MDTSHFGMNAVCVYVCVRACVCVSVRTCVRGCMLHLTNRSNKLHLCALIYTLSCVLLSVPGYYCQVPHQISVLGIRGHCVCCVCYFH